VNNFNDIAHLEEQARKEREQLHASAEDLRRKVSLTKEQMQPSNLAREHFGVASCVAALLGLALGYGMGNAITRG